MEIQKLDELVDSLMQKYWVEKKGPGRPGPEPGSHRGGAIGDSTVAAELPRELTPEEQEAKKKRVQRAMRADMKRPSKKVSREYEEFKRRR